MRHQVAQVGTIYSDVQRCGPDGLVNISYRVVSDVQRTYFQYSLPSIYIYVLVTIVVRLWQFSYINFDWSRAVTWL